MSRRGKEFSHRTAIFEGAFRAWSHLGGLSLAILDKRTVQELDPTTFVVVNDDRLDKISSPIRKSSPTNLPPVDSGSNHRREFAYETLPRSGLLHPFVKAVLSSWLGSAGVDHEALEIGLGTLRTWWQHRRKGENKTAVRTLDSSDKMRDTLDRYTRHFFELAHRQVMAGVEAPPTLKKKLYGREKKRRNLRGSASPEGTFLLRIAKEVF